MVGWMGSRLSRKRRRVSSNQVTLLFSFFFISPLLWLFHAFMAGMSFLINTLLGVCIGNAGGGLIDLVIFGILRGTETKWILNVVIGLIYAVIYFL